MNPIEQTMPSFDAMAKQEYTAKEWLNFYRNVWVRNLVARTIDVQRDRMLKELNPNKQVQLGDVMMPVKERLEHFKMNVEDALAILRAIDLLRCLDNDELEEKNWTPGALAVAPDMVEEKAEAMMP